MSQFIRMCFATCLLLILSACGDNQHGNRDKSPGEMPVEKEIQKPVILVSGVTGRQGGAVAQALLKSRFSIRGLTRNPDSQRAKKISALGIELVKGDFSDTESLRQAMTGVYGVFSVQNFWEHGYEAEVQQGKNLIDAAVAANVEHFIFSSVASANHNTGIPHFDSKYETEQYLAAARIPFTIFRPVAFMDNWEYSKEKILSGTLSSPFSESARLQQIAVKDIGRFVALAFEKPEDWLGVSFDIAGEEYTLKEVVNLFSRITGSPVIYQNIPWDAFEENSGTEMAIMDRWIENTGYQVNINLVRSKLQNMQTLENYLLDSGW